MGANKKIMKEKREKNKMSIKKRKKIKKICMRKENIYMSL
jgi:hypothetical protein